jgi:hypothetical protein
MDADQLFSAASRSGYNDQLEQHEKQSNALVCHTAKKSNVM